MEQMQNTSTDDKQVSPPPQIDVPKPATDRFSNIERKLDEVVQQLRLMNHVRQHQDFSLAKLVAIVVQLMVVALLFWITVGALDLPELQPVTATTMKLFAAITLQLLALTCFILDRRH